MAGREDIIWGEEQLSISLWEFGRAFAAIWIAAFVQTGVAFLCDSRTGPAFPVGLHKAGRALENLGNGFDIER